jgi:hypothetical protein
VCNAILSVGTPNLSTRCQQTSLHPRSASKPPPHMAPLPSLILAPPGHSLPRPPNRLTNFAQVHKRQHLSLNESDNAGSQTCERASFTLKAALYLPKQLSEVAVQFLSYTTSLSRGAPGWCPRVLESEIGPVVAQGVWAACEGNEPMVRSISKRTSRRDSPQQQQSSKTTGVTGALVLIRCPG